MHVWPTVLIHIIITSFVSICEKFRLLSPNPIVPILLPLLGLEFCVRLGFVSSKQPYVYNIYYTYNTIEYLYSMI